MSEERQGWNFPPAEPFGNLNSRDVAFQPDEAWLREFSYKVIENRYGLWNARTPWFKALLAGLDEKTVCDYGCGFGFAGLVCQMMGCRVFLSDIEMWNVVAATRIFLAHGYEPAGSLIGKLPSEPYDVLIMDGVLHHIPWDEAATMIQALPPCVKEIRAMVYTKRTWEARLGAPAPQVVESHPAYRIFVALMDAVGYHADWYDPEKLERRFPVVVKSFTYLPDSGDDRHFAVARMERL